jgi:hypothetical protein
MSRSDKRPIDAGVFEEIVRINQELYTGTDVWVVPDQVWQGLDDEQRMLLLAELQRIGAAPFAASAGRIQAEPHALRLVSRGFPELLARIRKLEPFQLGVRYTGLRLIDFGGESFVFRGRDESTGHDVVVKMSFVDFSGAARVDVEQLRRRRRRLRKEAAVLARMRGTVLPDLVDELQDQNPFFPRSFPPFLRAEEVFVVMEYIAGTRFDLHVRHLHRDGRGCCARGRTLELAIAFLDLQREIADRLGAASIYTDIKPENALVGERIRIVDASSVHLADEDGPAHVSELYLDPADHRAWAAGALRLDDGYVLRSVARCVRMLATNAPAVIGAALPPWPDATPAAFRASIDDLPGAVTLARATTALQTLLPELACSHRSHPG